MDRDLNLLFRVLAVQLRKVTPNQLVGQEKGTREGETREGDAVLLNHLRSLPRGSKIDPT